jgi:hypothetical protein
MKVNGSRVLLGTAALALFLFRCIAAQKGELPEGMVVGPYLQWPTQTSMIVRWETAEPATSLVEWGETSPPMKRASVEGKAQYHEVVLRDLKPETQYFYRVVSASDSVARIAGKVSVFRTAVRPDSPFAFVVISDSQANPAVVKKIAALAYSQRPNFTLHCGDLVTDGRIKEHWTGHYFPNSAALNRCVPLLPMLGTHEKNAHFYYDYFSLPAPEYYYEFQYGNADFFVFDSQQDVSPQSEQYRWLKKELAASRAIGESSPITTRPIRPTKTTMATCTRPTDPRGAIATCAGLCRSTTNTAWTSSGAAIFTPTNGRFRCATARRSKRAASFT